MLDCVEGQGNHGAITITNDLVDNLTRDRWWCEVAMWICFTSRDDSGQVVHTHICICHRQYTSVTTKGRLNSYDRVINSYLNYRYIIKFVLYSKYSAPLQWTLCLQTLFSISRSEDLAHISCSYKATDDMAVAR